MEVTHRTRVVGESRQPLDERQLGLQRGANVVEAAIDHRGCSLMLSIGDLPGSGSIPPLSLLNGTNERGHLASSLTSSLGQLALLFGCESILVAVDVVICQSQHVTAEFLGAQKWARGGVCGTYTDESGDEAGDDRREGERGNSSD